MAINDLASGDASQSAEIPQIAFAVGKQVGPDGKTLMVGLHLGTGVMSAVVVIPAQNGDQFADELCRQIKKAAMECRITNSGIQIR